MRCTSDDSIGPGQLVCSGVEWAADSQFFHDMFNGETRLIERCRWDLPITSPLNSLPFPPILEGWLSSLGRLFCGKHDAKQIG